MLIGGLIAWFILVIFGFLFSVMLKHLDKKHGTVGTGANILEDAVPTVQQKTAQKIIAEVLSNPPVGCMWEVKKVIKHYRKLPNGNQVFDGSVEKLFAEVTLITPFGKGRVFSLPVGNLDDFEKEMIFNARVSVVVYENDLALQELSEKKNTENWDGIYS